MDKSVIEGVAIQPLKQVVDARGKVMHMMRADSPLFTKFGEIYFSVVNPGVVKAWKRHLKMTQHFTVPVGKIKLAVYDDRSGSSTKNKIEVIEFGEENYCLVRIPPLLWYGFKGISDVPAMIANCADIPHDPLETEKLPENDKKIPFNWNE